MLYISNITQKEQKLTIKLIIFDFDGVLVDSEFIAGKVITKQLEARGIKTNLATILQNFVGLDDAAKRLILADFIGKNNVEAFILETKSLSRIAYTQQLKPLPHVEAVLSNLKINKCIASNSHPDSLKVKIKVSKLDRFFAASELFVGAMVEKPKPAPDLYLHAAKTYNVMPNECLVVEDSVHGIHAAVAAEMHVIGYSGASHCYNGYDETLKKAGVKMVFNNMSKLPSLLDSFNTSHH